MNTSTTLCLFLLLLCLFVHANKPKTDSSKPKRWVTKMIHRASPSSPFFDPKKSTQQRINEDIKLSLEYHNEYFRSEKIYTRITPLDGPRLFFAHLSFGSDRTEQLLAMDTGSSMMWIYCKPCVCDYLEVTLYDPKSSFTYSDDINCKSLVCSSYYLSTSTHCGPSDECSYRMQYVTGFAAGNLSQETIATSDGHVFEDVIFGCTKKAFVGDDVVYKYNGVLGLGQEKISLVQQSELGKFSYCIGDLYDLKGNDDHKLIFGEPVSFGADVKSTPMVAGDHHYVVNLESIYIGNIRLKISEKEFRGNGSYTGGVILDTGTTHSILQKDTYSRFMNEILRLTSEVKKVQAPKYFKDKFDLCFEGQMDELFDDFPEVEFVFYGDAKLVHTFKSMFEQFDDVFCWAFINPGVRDLPCSIFGVRIQQFHYTSYDLEKQTVSFSRADCAFVK